MTLLTCSTKVFPRQIRTPPKKGLKL